MWRQVNAGGLTYTSVAEEVCGKPRCSPCLHKCGSYCLLLFGLLEDELGRVVAELHVCQYGNRNGHEGQDFSNEPHLYLFSCYVANRGT